MVSKMAITGLIASKTIGLARGLAITMLILLIPAFLLAMTDLMFDFFNKPTNFLGFYRPVLEITAFAVANILIPIFFVFDYVVNSFLDFLSFDFITVRLNLSATIPTIQKNFTEIAIGISTLGLVDYASSGTNSEGSGSSSNAGGGGSKAGFVRS